MKRLYPLFLLASLALAIASSLRAADQTNLAAPVEKNAKFDALRTNYAARAGFTNQLDELRNLTPEQRRAKIEEFRARRAATGTNPAALGLSQEERLAKLKARLEELRQKNAAGNLTPAEHQQLTRLESVMGRARAEPRTPGVTNSPPQTNAAPAKDR